MRSLRLGSHVQLFPGGLRSPRLTEAHLLDAWGGYGAELLLVLRRCPALRRLSLACQPRAQGGRAMPANCALELPPRPLSLPASARGVAASGQLGSGCWGCDHVLQCRVGSRLCPQHLLQRHVACWTLTAG